MRAMQIPSDDPLLLRIVDDLAVRGWSQQPIFLPQVLTRALAAECRKRAAEGELALRPSGAGRFQRSARAFAAITSSGWSRARSRRATCTWA